jgi:Domain of unknown function (DUF5085)
MCNLHDFMHYSNVVSKSYLVPKDRSELAIQDFLAETFGLGLKCVSLPFLTIDILEKDMLRICIYISIEADSPELPADMHFDSYFAVDDMASICVTGDVQNNMSGAYVKLYDFLENESKRAITPAFHVMGGDQSLQYTIVKVGYTGAVNPAAIISTDNDLE